MSGTTGTAPSDWQTISEAKDGSMKVENLGGVSWHETPAPPRFHKHWAQTRGYTNYLNYMERCPCGAYGPDWILLRKKRTSGLTKLRIRDILHL